MLCQGFLLLFLFWDSENRSVPGSPYLEQMELCDYLKRFRAHGEITCNILQPPQLLKVFIFFPALAVRSELNTCIAHNYLHIL